MESTELAIREETPTDLIGYATDVAGACKAIVTATARQIGQKRYVQVEGWQAIALAHGCITSSRNVQRIETGFSAIGEVRRRSDGAVLAEAEGFVGDDEEMWAKRTEHARRAMAQTRAISRACRAAFAHVVVMMQAGLETTPAEEMPEHGTNGHAPAPPTKAAPRNVTPPVKATAPPSQSAGAVTSRGVVERTTVKEGVKNGKAWQLTGVQIATDADGTHWYNTFDLTVGDVARSALHQQVEFVWKPGKPRTDGTPSRDLVEILGILFDEAPEADDAREPDAEG